MAMAIAVRTRLFARLREQAGTDAETVEVRPGSTVDDVYDALQKAHARLEANRESVRVAVNQEFADWDAIVSDGDEVAFIPPVSGGTHAVRVLFAFTTHPPHPRRPEAPAAPQGPGPVCPFPGHLAHS